MRRIIASEMITLDGFFEGPNREIDWHNVDEEFNEYAGDLLKSVDALFMGRVTYELMAGYWPTPAAETNDRTISERMNSLPKIVFSKTLEKADWNNTRLLRKIDSEDISNIKRQPGKDIALFGSASILSALMQMNLIDEYRLMVNPVVLGNGRPLFGDGVGKSNLELIRARAFRSGNVLLYYRPTGRRLK